MREPEIVEVIASRLAARPWAHSGLFKRASETGILVPRAQIYLDHCMF